MHGLGVSLNCGTPFLLPSIKFYLYLEPNVVVMLQWIKKMFAVGDEVSSKRFVGITGSLSLVVTMFVNSFTHQTIAPSDSLVDAVMIISIGALGLTSADKFTKKQ